MVKISPEKARAFIDTAHDFANRFSKDEHKKVGCMILDSDTLFIKACGYNGMPFNVSETTERWSRPIKNFYVQHAEMNCICSAARHGTPLNKSICIVTYHPCTSCAKALIQSGISTVITHPPNLQHPRWGEEFKIAQELFKESGIDLVYV